MDAHLAQLMKVFRFDEGDLTANRAGTLSPRQAQQKKNDEAWANRVIVIIALLTGAGAVLLLLPMARAGELSGGDKVGELVFGILLALASVWLWRSVLFTRLDHTVLTVQGPMKLVKSVHRSGNVSDPDSSRLQVTRYEMVIGGNTFGVTPDIFNTVLLEHEGDIYAAYFTRNPDSLLSLEPVAPARDT